MSAEIVCKHVQVSAVLAIALIFNQSSSINKFKVRRD
jgi:hypothetical protein